MTPPRWPKLALVFVVALVFALGLSGCATTNVRALRAYANEDPQLVVALDRLDDVAEVLRLLDVALMEVPYSPGDAWVGKLALDDVRAGQLMAVVRSRPPYDDRDFHVPVMRLYRLHLAEVIHQERMRKRAEPADYPSLMAALRDLHQGHDIAALWRAYEDANERLVAAELAVETVKGEYSVDRIYSSAPPPEYIEAKDEVDAAEDDVEQASARLTAAVDALRSVQLNRGQRKAIARDTLTAFSVVLRNDLEAVALIPFALANTFRGTLAMDKTIKETLLTSVKKRNTFATIEKLSDLPDLADGIGARLERQLELAEHITDTLGELAATALEDTAGFALEESVVDQIVGITLDSFHAELDVDAEMLMFAEFGGDDARTESEDSDGNVRVVDITGRSRRLAYEVSPIYMLGIHANIGFDFIKLPNAATLGGGYTTDRVFSSGGSITETSLGEQLGLSGVASDVFAIGLGLLGVQSNVKIATFDFGQATELELDPVDDDEQGVAEDADGDDRITDFELRYTQIDVGYDFAFLVSEWARRWYIEELYLGYRYFDYELPRILYEVGGSDGLKTFRRQSPAQFVPTRFHMGGFRVRFGPSGDPRVRVFGDLGLFFGAGPVSYYFCEDEADPCTEDPDENDREEFAGSIGGLNATLGLGTQVRLTPKGWPVDAHVALEYRAEVIGTLGNSIPSVDGEEREVRIENNEIFHGPQLQIQGSL
jgi:hypothetical protein